MKRRAKERKLARLVLAAILSTGGLAWSPTAQAAEYSWGGLFVDDPIMSTPTSIYYYLNPTSEYKTLNLVSPGNTDKFVAGGYRNDATALTGYTINVNSGGWDGIYGAFAYAPSSGIVSQNTVTVNGGGVIKAIVGGVSTGSGNVDNNTVNIKNGSVGYGAGDAEYLGAKIRGGYIESGSGNVTNNNVNIEGGKINAAVFGGKSDSAGDVTGNHVTITGGTVKAGNTGIIGGESSSGAANNNTVTISGGTINSATIIGGHTTNGGSADGNTVTISGSPTFEDPFIAIHGAQGDGDMKNNTVNILTKITVGSLIGGESWSGTSSGNTLNIAAVGVRTGSLNPLGMPTSFQNINFYLPEGIQKNGESMLTVTGGMASDLRGVTFGATALTSVSLAKGDTVNLLVNESGLTTDATTNMDNKVSASLGTAEFLTPNNLATDTKYTLGISKKDDNTIIATVEEVKDTSGGGGTEGGGGSTDTVTDDRLKSPVETRAATVTLLNAGADMLASQGFSQAANAVALEAAESGQTNAQGAPMASTFTPFAAFGGSSMRAESGSHVDTKGFGINVGFAKEFANSQGKLLFGPVVEYGGGKYDSYNNDIHGDGGSHYWGIGIMARQVNHDGFYYEGSIRGGRVTSDYSSQMGAAHVSYDTASNYWAAHLGLGKAMNVGGNNTLDAYLKYFYSHQGGDDTTIHIAGGNDEKASFDSIDSNRIRIGARLTHKVNEMNSFYGGLAYQYEFGGEARAHYSISGTAPSPSVKGSSGMLELGWQVKPGGPVTIDLGIAGWAGKQRGGSVQLGATWTF